MIGLGNMGRNIALRLADERLEVCGFDPLPQARAAVQPACRAADTLADAVRGVQAVILSLPTSRHVEEVLRGNGGLFELATSPLLIVDMSTSDPRSTEKLAAAAAASGHAFVDAPVSGGPARARDGTLAIALGGTPADRASARPLIDKLARVVIEVGEAGSAHLAKLVNNFLCASSLAITGDLCRLATALGHSPEKIIEWVNAASGRSAVTELNFPRWIFSGAFDSGFTMALMSKDVALTREIAQAGSGYSEVLRAVVARWEDDTHRLGGTADFNRIADQAPSRKELA